MPTHVSFVNSINTISTKSPLGIGQDLYIISLTIKPRFLHIFIELLFDDKIADPISINEKTVFKYYFVRPLLDGKSDNQKGYLVFGLDSLCNHQESPNAYVDWVEDRIGLWSHLIAHKDINIGEEVTLFYANIDDYSDVDKFV